MDSYRLNPFAIVSEVEDGFLIGGSNRLQVRLPGELRAFLDLLAGGRAFSLAELRRYLSDGRIEEMQRKHVLLSGSVPPVTGRYSRQLGFFSLISDDYRLYHDRITAADILLLGGGAIGTHVLWNLAAMGAARITIVDFDVVEESNLNRQALFSECDLGQLKVEVLAKKIRDFNPAIAIRPVNQRISSRDDVERWIPGKTLVIKAIDTPEESTEWVNEACVRHKVPFIAGGFLDDVGVVGPVYLPGESVCFACIRPQRGKRRYGTGATFAPLTGIISSRISMCIFRILAGITQPIANKLFTYDTLRDVWETIDLSPAGACNVCGRQPAKAIAAKASAGFSPIWSYRAAIMLLMLLVGIITSITRDRYTGLVMLAALVFSMPTLDLICRKAPDETRWQIFVTSCVYCLLSLGIVVYQKGLPFRVQLSNGIAASFLDLVEQSSALIIALVLAITCLCCVLYGFMYAVKVVTGEKEKWMS